MTEPRWLDETQQAAWQAMLVVFSRAFPEIERAMRPHGILAVQYGVLVALSQAPGRSLRLGDLAAHANMSQSRLTHRMRDLVAHGDVEVADDPHDRRSKRATLTETGLDRLRSLAPHHVETVQSIVFDHLTAQQTAALADAMSSIAASLCDRSQERVDP
ncbi:MarR family winged helix-turn-helix transcriptional regulator [Nocardioides salarius]|uniref:MarR family winged helix-turn-helix transcriptional regulator n=1 Tax=Nocardioides salarius TaxID=374513 RepID=UPI0030FB69AC